MIDVGFNLLAWTVLKRKSVKHVDGALRSCISKRNPYGVLRIKSSTDPMDGKWRVKDLAQGMNMGDAQLFQQEYEASKLISEIICQRSNDETSITGSVLVNDANTCMAKISISIMSKRKSIQMAIECQIIDLIYPTREVHKMTVRFYSGDKEICFDVDPTGISAESFFAALNSKDDCKLLIRGCRMFATGPDAWAAHLREIQGNGKTLWQKASKGRRGEKKIDLGLGGIGIPKVSMHTMYQALFKGESYGIDLFAGSNIGWTVKSNWADKFKFSVYWKYCDDYLLLQILENDYISYDWLSEGMEIGTFAGEDLPSKPLVSETPSQPLEAKKPDADRSRKQEEKLAWKKRRKEALRGVEDMTGNHAIQRPIEHVHINDLIVRSSMRTCWNKDHEIREVIAIVCVFNPKKGVVEVAVDAFCCPQCKRYYILQKAFDRLKNKGALCCKVITRPGVQYDFMSRSALGLSDQSIYNSLGYNVNADEGLTPQERRAVLDFVIENGFRTQKETIGFLEGRINYNGRKRNMENAVAKWESDIDYLIRNKGKKTERVKIDRIFLTEHTKWK